MTDREKLIEILQVPIYPHELSDPTEAVADYLLDNGVTLDNQVSSSKWIPVSEKLPEKKGTYLICTNNFGIVMAHWYGERFGGGYAAKCVTHWMPLPQPPKEEA